MSRIVETPSLVRSTCQSRIDFSIRAEPLHKGKSTVYPACTSNNHCPYIVKMREIRNADDLMSFLQEQFFAQYISEKSALVSPKIFDAWICRSNRPEDVKDPAQLSGFLVMERFDGTLRQLAPTLTDHDYSSVAGQLFRLTGILVELNLLHRHITLDNVLYRKGSFELALTDWDDVTWQNNHKKLDNEYQGIIEKLLAQLHRVQKREAEPEVKREPFRFSSDVYQPYMTPLERPVVEPSQIQSLPLGVLYRPEQPEDVLPSMDEGAAKAA